MMKKYCLQVMLIFLSLVSIANDGAEKGGKKKMNARGQEIFQDVPYMQEYAVKFLLAGDKVGARLDAVSVNRDGQIRILSDQGILVPENGGLFFPGSFVKDVSYPPTSAKRIRSISTYQDQTIYLDSIQIFSNAWAGKVQIEHDLPRATLFQAGKEFEFLISDGDRLIHLDRNGKTLWSGNFEGLIQIRYCSSRNRFLLISRHSVAEYVPGYPIQFLFRGSGITSATYIGDGKKIAVGTDEGCLMFPEGRMISKLPSKRIRCMEEIDGGLWFGTELGVCRMDTAGKYAYYAGERWLPGDRVIQLMKGPDGSVLVLTEKGLTRLSRQKMTLEEKALFYEKQVREKNIRYGLNCSSVRLVESYSSAMTANQPSDNLWTAMYLVGQLYHYKVTGSREARQNAYESFEALERLHTVTGIRGLFGRSFERDHITENNKGPGWREQELRSGSPASLWLPAADYHNWTWRSTASSDQTVGQVYALTTILELVDDQDWRSRALKCLDDLMGYILDNDLYIIDVDGEPTMWGKWNPDYVNHLPENVGDRKITSSNIIAFLQTAYRFTGKSKYKNKALELMNEKGYLQNLMRPMSEIGRNDQNQLSSALSEEWNHSDDEMYFLAYWGLYPYAFTAELKEKYRVAIRDHWNIERPEEDALWNLTYAMTGAKEFDLDKCVRYLRNYPLDLRNWSVHNSHREDLERLPANFRGQTIKSMLPLGEMPILRHNAQVFNLDSPGDGKSLISAGDTWLLPYWMGRYLGVISGPVQGKK